MTIGVDGDSTAANDNNYVGATAIVDENGDDDKVDDGKNDANSKRLKKSWMEFFWLFQ